MQGCAWVLGVIPFYFLRLCLSKSYIIVIYEIKPHRLGFLCIAFLSILGLAKVEHLRWMIQLLKGDPAQNTWWQACQFISLKNWLGFLFLMENHHGPHLDPTASETRPEIKAAIWPSEDLVTFLRSFWVPIFGPFFCGRESPFGSEDWRGQNGNNRRGGEAFFFSWWSVQVSEKILVFVSGFRGLGMLLILRMSSSVSRVELLSWRDVFIDFVNNFPDGF